MTQPNPDLSLNQKGKEVALLHNRLMTIGYTIDTSEILGEVFGQSTYQAVVLFQRRNGLPATGVVDAATAEAIISQFESERTTTNLTLSELARPQTPQTPPGPPQETPGTPPHEAAAFTSQAASPATSPTPLSPQPRLAAPLPGSVVASPAPAGASAAPGKSGDAGAGTTNAPARASNSYTVDGTVSSPNRAGVGGLRVLIVDRNVGQDISLAETTTNNRGGYQVSFPAASLLERHKAQPDVQARVYSGQTFLAASDVRYNATTHETLNITLPAAASAGLPSEYETLTYALAANYSGQLSDLQESADRQDITYLANKTGWDARAVALAALAEQFSQRTAKSEIAPLFFYALFRAGLPANEETLYRADRKTLEAVWNSAAEQGVIPKGLTSAITKMVELFQSLSAQKLLAGPAVVGASSLQEMLSISLPDSEYAKFAELYTAYQTDMPTFWQEVTKTFGQDVAARLQVDGKLGFLTINDAPLMKKLHQVVGGNRITDPVQLALAGYHQADAWSKLLTADIPVPKEIPGDQAAQRANYAAYLAAQVRLSYPTAAVAQMVRSGYLQVASTGQVAAFLTEHQGKFEIGVQPVEQYLARNKLNVAQETVTQVKRLQRVYQITPSDQAMAGLLKRGVDAAYHIVRYDKETFIETYQQDLGGVEAAQQTYAKSVQVYNAVLNIAVSYLTAKNGIPLGSMPLQTSVQNTQNNKLVLQPVPAPPSADNAGDVIAYPTLEGLFGSMDFCTCDDCRSVLSPAAYLVDLLHFIDQDPLEAGKKNPQMVLLQDRRPDIQYLPLTCENTNTALPYIDVVNETLEYFVVNKSLSNYAGHDTGSAASEDLLASPQFVNDATYTTLQSEFFPMPLPFHQPLENLRRYFNTFGVPLPLAMERLRKNDDLEGSTNPYGYGWRDIWMEVLGLSRAEYQILTDSTAVPLWQLYGFPNGTADADVIAALSNAKQFSRRLGITYEDVVALLRTFFINPNSDLLPKLERLGVSFAILKALKDGTITDADFDALLANLAVPPDPAEYGGDIKAWVKDNTNYARIMGLIMLAIPTGSWTATKAYALGDCVRPTAPPSDSTLYYECMTFGTSAASEPTWPTTLDAMCNDGTVVWTCRNAASCSSFDNEAFRYSDPAKITQNMSAVEFVRFLRFIRLWKKLGWTIEQTDAAICALYLYRTDLAPLSAGDIDTVAKLDAGFLTLLPRLGIIIRVINTLNLTINRDLLPLLACWSQIGTHGESALYRQMFLTPTLLKQDSAFADNGYGEFLTDTSKKLTAHAEGVRSAFNLTADEYTRIVTALQYNDSTLLTLRVISEIYRRGWLARKLRLSVRELLLLTSLTGLDPFAPPDPSAPAILDLLSLVQALKDRSLKTAAALYLIWNQDLSGKSAPNPAQITELARTLRSDYANIENQFAAIEDPNGDIARARMTLVYGQEAADVFFALLDDTLPLDVPYTNPKPTLDTTITAVDSKLTYDDFRHRLADTGVLSATTRDALKQVAGVTATFQQAVDALFARSEDVKGSFFTRYPELKPLYDAYIASTDPPDKKRSALLAAFQPELARLRKRQQAEQRLSAAANIDLAFTQAILDASGTPYPLHAAGHTDQPALNDVLVLETPGLATQFFYRDTATGAVDLSVSASANLDYFVSGGNPLPTNPTSGNAISGIWSGSVETPEAGYYNIVIEADATASVTLSFGGQPQPLTQNGTIWRNTNPLNLNAGTLYDISLTVEKVKDALGVKWETPKRPREVIPGRYLYSPSIIPSFSDVYSRFLKVASLAVGLRLTANEMARFATNTDYQIAGDGWLSALPVTGDPDSSTAAALLKPLQGLLDFARIKADLSSGDERLLMVLADPVTASASPDGPLSTLTRWDAASLTALLSQFGGTIAGLVHLDLFRRVYDAFALLQTMGIAGGALLQATTNEPTGDTVRAFQAALRARYAAADWRNVVQPINDEMRGLQRDALVTYSLHQMSKDSTTAQIETPDQLFEYFLMDVQMEPCMQTSRIRHALSSVQLFIERCLMNLEPRVSLSSITAKRWEWMKRYRVWEANRKVFLWPENWLEPELRDDKSPFFKEIESELLQSDITEDSATTALLNYLAKLEEVAKLEPCGIYHIDADQSQQTGEVNHVIARTAGAQRKYYHRRYEHGYWTPWEQIKLDIEDNPVIPVIWNGRLLLFWLKILKQGQIDPNAQLMSEGPTEQPDHQEKSVANSTLSDIKDSAKTDAKTNTKITVQAMLCWSEYYNGKWQPTKTSDANRPVTLGKFDVAGTGAFDRSQVTLSVDETGEPLQVTISSTQSGGDMALFLFYNTHSLPVSSAAYLIYLFGKSRSLQSSGNQFTIRYTDTEAFLSNTELDRNVLTDPISFTTISPAHRLQNAWDAPFFFEDSRHVFYVTTAEQRVWISTYPGYGVTINPGFSQTANLPPLIVQNGPQVQVRPNLWGNGGPVSANPGVTDPAPMQRFITEDAYIRQGIGTIGSVMYSGIQIGPAGVIANGRAQP